LNPAGSISYTVFKPDGSQLFSDSWTNNNSNNLPALPVSGFYTLVVDPPSTSIASLNLWLSKDIPGQFVVGQTLTVSSSRVGQNFRPTFNGVAGERYWLAFNGSTLSSATVNIVKPDGAMLTSFSISTSAANVEIPALPTTGTYAVYIDPSSTITGKVDVQLNQVAPDITGPIELNGSALPLALSVRQRAMLTFNGTAGQRLGLGYANVTTNPVSQSITYTVLKPDGSQLFSDSWINSNSNNLPVLPVSGTYTIRVQSGTFATSSLSLLLSGEVTGTLVPDAAPLNVNIARVGQNARLTFDAVAGQQYWLRLRGGTFPSSVSMYVYKPDGSTLATTSVSGSQDLDTGVLPASGTYSVWFDPTSVVAGKVDVELVTIAADSVGTIAVDGAGASVNLAPGQRSVLSFFGVAGQRLGLGYTGVSTVPASTSIYYSVNKPDGTQLFNDNWTTNNSNDLPALPVNGTYTVVVKGYNFATAVATVWLSADVAGTLVQNDAAMLVPLARVGQNARLTFNGVAGQAYTLRFTGGTFPSSVNVMVLNPSGSSMSSTSVSSSGTLSLSALAITGTYTVFIGPSGTVTGQVNVQLQ
jgi:hypothetical protein